MNLEINYITLFLIIFLLLLIDLWSKSWVEKNLNQKKYLFNGKIELFYVRNYGVAFNLLSNKKNLIFGINIILFIFLVYQGLVDPQNSYYYGMILAGGLGNFIGRVRRGYVVDFIYFNIKRFPVFNIADFEILIGVCILLIKEFR